MCENKWDGKIKGIKVVMLIVYLEKEVNQIKRRKKKELKSFTDKTTK